MFAALLGRVTHMMLALESWRILKLPLQFKRVPETRYVAGVGGGGGGGPCMKAWKGHCLKLWKVKSGLCWKPQDIRIGDSKVVVGVILHVVKLEGQCHPSKHFDITQEATEFWVCPAGFWSCFGLRFPYYASISPFWNGNMYLVSLYVGSMYLFFYFTGGYSWRDCLETVLILQKDYGEFWS